MYGVKISTQIGRHRGFLPNCLGLNRNLTVHHALNTIKGVHEDHVKGRYHKEEPTFKNFQEFLDGFKRLRGEFKLLATEAKELLQSDPFVLVRHGEIFYVWKFDGKNDDLKNWIVTSDSDHCEGYSVGKLELSQAGKGLFSGTLSTVVPKDGIVRTAGYSNITTIRPTKSFQRDAFHEWHDFNHLVLRVRGDGRTYLLNLKCQGYYDILWNDSYHYVLHTRGGPYWQMTKIPFSKFAMGSKGKAQDTQPIIDLDSITQFGITVCDKINGPFSLEIDYIGLEYDESHTEKTAYELYKSSPIITGV